MSKLVVLMWMVVGLGCSSSDSTPSVTDAAADGVSSDTGGPSACGTKTCAAGETCVRTYTTGGACLSCGDDAAACPAGSHCGGACCVADAPSYAYACKPTPSTCSAGLACGAACADAICSGGCPCESATGTMMTCHCLAP